MITKKIAITFTAAIFSVAMFAGTSFAAWNTCTPNAIGPKGDIVRLQVTNCAPADPSSGKGWVTLNATGTDQQMATILTAMSLNKTISVQTIGDKDASGYDISTSVIFINE